MRKNLYLKIWVGFLLLTNSCLAMHQTIHWHKNWCFVDAVIHCLAENEPFRNYLDNYANHGDRKQRLISFLKNYQKGQKDAQPAYGDWRTMLYYIIQLVRLPNYNVETYLRDSPVIKKAFWYDSTTTNKTNKVNIRKFVKALAANRYFNINYGTADDGGQLLNRIIKVSVLDEFSIKDLNQQQSDNPAISYTGNEPYQMQNDFNGYLNDYKDIVDLPIFLHFRSNKGPNDRHAERKDIRSIVAEYRLGGCYYNLQSMIIGGVGHATSKVKSSNDNNWYYYNGLANERIRVDPPQISSHNNSYGYGFIYKKNELFSSRRTPVNMTDEDFLLLGVAEDNVPKVKDIIKKDKKFLTQIFGNSQTIFHFVCRWGSKEVLKYLLEQNNIEVNKKNLKYNNFFPEEDPKPSNTPLYEAIKNRRVNIVQLLANDPRVDLEVVDSTAEKPLAYAKRMCAQRGHPFYSQYQEIIDILEDAKKQRKDFTVDSISTLRSLLILLKSKLLILTKRSLELSRSLFYR